MERGKKYIITIKFGTEIIKFINKVDYALVFCFFLKWKSMRIIWKLKRSKERNDDKINASVKKEVFKY